MTPVTICAVNVLHSWVHMPQGCHMEKQFLKEQDSVSLQKRITELEFQLRQADRMGAIGTLTGGVAHDFNNILFLIMGYTEMCVHKISDGDSVNTYLEKILVAANRAKDLIQQIHDFSRGKEKEKRLLRMHLVVNESLKLLKAAIPSSISISSTIDKNCRAIMADPTQIRQVMMSLCTNARQVMGDEGLLDVVLKEVAFDTDTIFEGVRLSRGAYVSLAISVAGNGLCRDKRCQFADAPSPDCAGEGKQPICSTVVRQIVEAHGGCLTIYSEPGEGATYRVYFPVPCGEMEIGGNADSGRIEKGHERIFLVDDEEDLAEMLKLMLTELGYRVTSATSSTEALKIFKKRPNAYDLVVTDMTMPEMSGIELVKALFRTRPDLPVILSSGFSDVISQKKSGDLGIHGFLMKPASMSEIAGAIRRALDNHVPDIS